MVRSIHQPNAPLLNAADAGQLRGLLFVAHRLVEGIDAGRHRSPRRGHSTEFHDFRAYSPGDPLRRVDWKVFGRTDRLYVRRYRHDADLSMHLLVDRSASMDYAGAGSELPTKFTYARQLAAALALLAIQHNDKVSLTWLDEQAAAAMPLGGTPSHLRRIIDELENASCGGVAAPSQMRPMPGRPRHGRGLIVVISDMLDDAGDWLNAMGTMLERRLDVLALQVLTPTELDLRGLAASKLVDPETGLATHADARLVRTDYRRRITSHIQRLREGLIAHGGDHQLLLTTMPPIAALRRYVARRAAGLIGV